MALVRMAYVRVDRGPERHLLHQKKSGYIEQQLFDPDEGVRPQAPSGGVNGGGTVPSGDQGRTDHEQDAEQTRGGQAQSEIASSLSSELPKCIGCGPGTDDGC